MTAAGGTREEAASAYDALAPHYRDLSRAREAYLAAVDRFVIEHAPGGARSLLDVGAGDGVRGVALAARLGVRRVVLCEPSREMAARCRTHAAVEVWERPAEALPEGEERFDVVLCLWNVLGHLCGRAARLAALAGLRRVVAPGGAVFLDVNNRHNAAAYGRLRIAARRVVDYLWPDERRGDAAFHWQVDGARVPGKGHLFTPAEVEGLIAEAGLRVIRRLAVDYVSGACSASPFRGQLLYQAAP